MISGLQTLDSVRVLVKLKAGKTLSVRRDKDVVAESIESDSELVARARTGDLEAFQSLYRRYERRVYSAAYALTGNRADAEDIVQEGFIKAFRRLDSFKGQSSFYTWLYRIIANYAVDYSRKRYRKRERPMGQSSYSDHGLSLEHDSEENGAIPLFAKRNVPEDAMFESEMRKRLQQAIATLSPVHRAVIVMREIDGFSYDEISQTLGCSKGTVMSRLFHARQKLQEMLKPLIEIVNSGDESKEIE